jgi:hypothetical protein
MTTKTRPTAGSATVTLPSGREIVVARAFDAPRRTPFGAHPSTSVRDAVLATGTASRATQVPERQAEVVGRRA